MASKGYAVLDVQNDEDELEFQDFDMGGKNTQTHVFTDYPDSPGHQGAQDKLLGEYKDDDEMTPQTPAKELSFWSFDFYQQFFDVDSKKVGDRILWSMVPKPGLNYLNVHLRPKPDLYGPFWICLTLVFAAAITGNISNYLQTSGDQSMSWRYDFHKVSLAAFMVFSYGWLVPLVLWGVLRYRSSSPPLNLMEFTCLYGYSLSVLVPVCIVWTLPMVWLRWCAGIVGVVLSGAVLAKSVWEGLKGNEDSIHEEDEAQSTQRGSMKKLAMIILVIVIVMHISIALGFMFYFFREPFHANGARVAGVSAVSSAPLIPSGNLIGQVKSNVTTAKRDASNISNDIIPNQEHTIFNGSPAKQKTLKSGATEAVRAEDIEAKKEDFSSVGEKAVISEKAVTSDKVDTSEKAVINNTANSMSKSIKHKILKDKDTGELLPRIVPVQIKESKKSENSAVE